MPQTLIPHLDYAISAKAHTPMYLMHKFWARKPHNVVGEYIERYSKKGEIVLDPFVGSGVTAIEALKSGRKTIAIDLDPIAIFITRMTLKPINLKKFKEAFNQIERNVRDEIEKLYTTTCPSCGRTCVEAYVVWSDVVQCNTCNEKVVIAKATKEGKSFLCSAGHRLNPNKVVDAEPIEIGCECKTCLEASKNRVRFIIKELNENDTQDKERLSQIARQPIPYWYPKNVKLFYKNGRPFKKKETNDSIEDLFDRRSLVAHSIVFNEIEKIEDEEIRDMMKFVFSSNLHNVSRLNPVHQPRWKKKQHPSTSWIVHSYWVPYLRVELPFWFYFNERFQHILEGKKEAEKNITYYKEAKGFDDFKKDANIWIVTDSALNLRQVGIPKNSIDYVFTDPPYGGAIQYFELSMLWASWLRGSNNDPRFTLNFEEEITINESQEKSFETYHKMLRNAFEEIYEILKIGKYLTVTFHNTEVKIFNSIIKAVVMSGFDLEKIIYQPPARPSAKGLLQPYGSAVGDYYIRFRKPEKKTALSDSEIDKVRYDRIVVDSVRKIIAERGEPTPYSIIINSYSMIYAELKKSGYLFSAPESVEEILKKHINEDFELVDVKNEKGKVVGKKWWLKGVRFLDRVPLDERVEMAVINVLNRKHTASFDDVLEEVFVSFPNALTPDTQSIKDVLDEYAKKTKDGKWALDSHVKSRLNEHDKIVESLAQIGEKAGLNVHADLPIWRKDSFPRVSAENLSGVKEIDVVWFTKDEITHEFEVENTTGIWSAIIRGSNIPDGKVKRFIVIPEERQETFNKKISVPALKERMQKENWNFILYDRLKTFFQNVERKPKISSEEFDEIAQKPQLPKKIIENLDAFTDKE